MLACFTAALLDRKPLTLVDGGGARRTFLAVEEAVEAMRLMLERPGMARNRIFNLGNPDNETTIRGLAEMMRGTAADVTGDSSYLGPAPGGRDGAGILRGRLRRLRSAHAAH